MARPLLRAAPALAATALFALFALLWASGRHEAYFGLARLWNFHIYAFPFLDGEFVVDAVRCLHQGIDVYTVNPCDTHEHTPFDYSPLWSVFGFLPQGEGAVLAFSFASVATFLGSLLVLPPARDGRACALLTLAVISTNTAYAVERANNDILVFAALAGAAALLSRTDRARLWGYALLYLAAMMKYFPAFAMASALRERARPFLALTAASLAATLLALAGWHAEIARSLHAVPHGDIYGMHFGAPIVATLVQMNNGLAPSTIPVILAALAIPALVLAALAGLTPHTRHALAGLTGPEQTFLLVASLTWIVVFCGAQNALYRSIILLLAYPALVALARTARLGWLGAGVWLVPVLMWWSALEPWLEAAGLLTGMPALALSLLLWLLREALWWWLFLILASFATALLAEAPLAGEILARLRSRPLRAAGSSG